MTTDDDQESKREKIDKRRLFFYLLATPLFVALFLFLPAGDWLWIRGWLFVAVFYAALTASSLYLWRVNSDVVAARINPHQGTESWDKPLLGFLVVAWLTLLPLAALDDGRFHWLPMPWWVCILGYVLFLAGLGIMNWAEAVNKFFEPTVRLQADRGQTVIDSGPYAIVRHPGYVGGFLFSIGIPLALGSLWGLIPVVLASWVLILRTKWEDEMLQAKLSGYKEYAHRVRYRLLPGVW
jgi:protein-S-isoprenylcysteine O-methyltransferase Ste14